MLRAFENSTEEDVRVWGESYRETLRSAQLGDLQCSGNVIRANKLRWMRRTQHVANMNRII